jgi:hypothetical protein
VVDYHWLQKVMDFKSIIFTMAKNNCDKENCQIILLLKGFNNYSIFWKCFKSFRKHEKNNENITINVLQVLLRTPFSLNSFQIITNDSIG